MTGSLGFQYHIEKTDQGQTSVMSDMYRTRGLTNVKDIQEKLLLPYFTDCMIQTVNQTNTGDLVDKGQATIESIKECANSAVGKYHIAVEKVFDRGFGPSQEARQAMRKFSEAKQAGQIASIELQTAELRDKAASKNAGIYSTYYTFFKGKGVREDQIPAMVCLADPQSRERPCIPFTASGGAMVPVAMLSGVK